MEYDHRQHSPSFRLRLKSAFISYRSDSASSSSAGSDDDESFHRPAQSSRSSPSSWIRSRAFFSKIGSKASRRSNKTSRSEFSYDPMSYALNFEDDAARADEFPVRNFSARMPPSPGSENRFPAAVSREITACS